MSMPSIPEGKYRPSLPETVVDLLESIALEEIAISHILNAQGEKVQEIVKKYDLCKIDFSQMVYACKSTQEMVNALIMKEWLLYNKLGTVLNIGEDIGEILPEKKNLTPCENFVASGFGAGENCRTDCTCENCIHKKVCKNSK